MFVCGLTQGLCNTFGIKHVDIILIIGAVCFWFYQYRVAAQTATPNPIAKIMLEKP